MCFEIDWNLCSRFSCVHACVSLCLICCSSSGPFRYVCSFIFIWFVVCSTEQEMSYSLVLLLKKFSINLDVDVDARARLCVCVYWFFLFFSLFFCSSQSEENTNEASAVSYQEKIRQKFIFMYQWIEICLCRYASLHFGNKTERKPRLSSVEASNDPSKKKTKKKFFLASNAVSMQKE